MKTKSFDCVEMKRRAAARIHVEIGNLSLEQKIAYWHRRSQEFRAEQEKLARLAAPAAKRTPDDRP